MGGNWWTRAILNLLITLWGVWMLLPTLLGESSEQRLADQAESAQSAATGDKADEEVVTRWYDPLLPDARINLGLDLQGGIDMTLKVEVEEAVISQVQRDLKPIREAAESEGISVTEVRRTPGLAELSIGLGNPSEGEKLRGFMKLKYPGYELIETRDVDGVPHEVFRVTDASRQATSKRSVEQALETLRNRINETGVKEPTIVLKGGERINIQLPGMDNVAQAVNALGTTAVLEFMMVIPKEDLDPAELERSLLGAQKSMSPEEFKDDQMLSDYLARNGKIPPNTRLLWEYTKKGNDKIRTQAWVVEDDVILTGDDINNARTAMDPVEGPYVSLDFNSRGARVFSEVTGDNVGRHFAIVLDNEVSSAPRILQKISGGQCRITMGTGDYQQAYEEASLLALVLRTGSLPAPVSVGEVRTVGPSLGADLIESGSLASVIALGLVIIFMIWFYRFSGVLANIALAINVLLMAAFLAAFDATLTLPGIAGFALTVGNAVDCNVVIYERIREELRLGRTVRSAVDAGWDRAFVAILDANVAAFIAGIVLFTYGTGPIKGFAVTLMIGIVTTLITGVYTSRVLMDLYVKKSPNRISI